MLKVEKLNVHFGDFHALKDVSLEIPDGAPHPSDPLFGRTRVRCHRFRSCSFSALQGRRLCSGRRSLKELQKKLGITMVYVTHDQEEALTLSG